MRQKFGFFAYCVAMHNHFFIFFGVGQKITAYPHQIIFVLFSQRHAITRTRMTKEIITISHGCFHRAQIGHMVGWGFIEKIC